MLIVDRIMSIFYEASFFWQFLVTFGNGGGESARTKLVGESQMGNMTVGSNPQDAMNMF